MIEVQLEEEVQDHLRSLEADGLEIFTLNSGKIRGALASASTLVAQMRANHGLGILETLALGQASICAALLSATIKGDDRLSLRLDCKGPLGGFQVESNALGDVRGYLFSQEIVLENPLESLDLAPLIQGGSLSLTRFQGGKTEPFTGYCELGGGGIAAELSRYFLISEQTNTAFFTSVRLDPKGKLYGAGGLYLQALPGADPEALDWVERVLASAPSLGTWLGEGKSLRQFIIQSFLFSDIDFLGHKAISFSCPCSRKRFIALLSAMDKEEIGKALAEGAAFSEGRPCIEVRCQHCNTLYSIFPEELQAQND